MRILLCNLFIFVGGLVGIELAVGNWIGPVPRDTGTTCPSIHYHHDYCPGVAHRRWMSPADGGEIVINWINQSSVAVPTASMMSSVTTVAEYDVINIGDSFLEAEEVRFADRLSPQMERITGKRVLQVGYSSWAPIIMRNWLRRNPPRPGAHVNVFVMTNDMTTDYGLANINYAGMVKGRGPDGSVLFDVTERAPSELTTWQTITARSFMLYRLGRLTTRGTTTMPPKSKIFTDHRFASLVDHCADLDAFVAEARSYALLLRNYVEFSRSAQCWSETTRAAVDNAVFDLIGLRDDLAHRGVTLTVFLVSAGWAFDGENAIGKADPAWYGIAPAVTITQAGLGSYLAARLSAANVKFIDLEPVIRQRKRDDRKQWFFPVDGHWTSYAQAQLARFISQLR